MFLAEKFRLITQPYRYGGPVSIKDSMDTVSYKAIHESRVLTGQRYI
jgi:hypothetical protein